MLFVVIYYHLFEVIQHVAMLHIGDVVRVNIKLCQSKQMIGLLNCLLEHQLIIFYDLKDHRVFRLVTYLFCVAILDLAYRIFFGFVQQIVYHHHLFIGTWLDAIVVIVSIQTSTNVFHLSKLQILIHEIIV